MKKPFEQREINILMTVLATVILLAGCGDKTASGRVAVQTTGISDVLQSAMAEEDGKNAAEESTTAGSQPETETETETEDDTAGIADQGDVDIDLTVLSANMVYSTVFDMLYEPELYVGKTVKMEGMFTFIFVQETEKYLFGCIISDATACCSQGIEFIPTDDYHYPEGFPQGGENITVTGIFEILEDNGEKYIALTDAKIL